MWYNIGISSFMKQITGKFYKYITLVFNICISQPFCCIIMGMDDKKVYNYTKKTGRPPKYEGDKTVDKVYEYINSCIDEIEIFDKTVGDKSNSYERVLKTKIPTLAGLALYLEVNKATVYEWGKEHKDFSNALDDLTSLQEEKLLNGGVSGTYNSTISKLLLSSNHGYVDRKDVTTDGKAITINFDNSFNE